MKNRILHTVVLALCLAFAVTSLAQTAGTTGNVGIGTNTPAAKLQINSRSTPTSPSIAILDSFAAPSLQFRKLGLDSAFALTGGFGNSESSRGIILSWRDDSLLWVKSSGRLGLGTGNPGAKFQINHKASGQLPSLLVLD